MKDLNEQEVGRVSGGLLPIGGAVGGFVGGFFGPWGRLGGTLIGAAAQEYIEENPAGAMDLANQIGSSPVGYGASP